MSGKNGDEDNNFNTRMDTALPVDYSFKNFTELASTQIEYASATRVGGTVSRSQNGKKFLTKAIWLNNNLIKTTKNLNRLTESILEYPESLTYIDLSFNEIETISEDLFVFKNLTILHLHGNLIKKLSEVHKLKKLKKLQSITLYGNPVHDIKDYRSILIKVIPSLKKIDFNVVIKEERNCPINGHAVKYLNKLDNKFPDGNKNIPFSKARRNAVADIGADIGAAAAAGDSSNKCPPLCSCYICIPIPNNP